MALRLRPYAAYRCWQGRCPARAGARIGALAQASLATSSRFFELDATAWSNNTVRVLARNVSNTTIGLAAATLSVQITKRRVP